MWLLHPRYPADNACVPRGEPLADRVTDTRDAGRKPVPMYGLSLHCGGRRHRRCDPSHAHIRPDSRTRQPHGEPWVDQEQRVHARKEQASECNTKRKEANKMFVRLIPTIAVLLLGIASTTRAAEPLVVSVWGGNWKDTIDRVVAKPFTAKTGTPVEFEVGGTIDRLAKARVAKGSPLVDLTFTTSHVGRLYISDGLYQRLDMSKVPNVKEIAREAIRSPYHLGSWAYVYTVVYRPDLVKEEITRWSDLWNPALKGKIA